MNGNGIFLRDPGRLPPSARKQLEKIGDEKITSIKLVRTPLDSTTKMFLNIITLGQFDKITKKYHDDLFHLTMWINGKYNLEKNEVIVFGTKNPIKKNSQTQDINVNKDIDFNTLLEKTRKYMGDDKFTSYNAESNNCQNFILSILNANGLGTQQDKEFVKQDTKEVFDEIPSFSKIIGNLATTAGAVVNKLIEGEGRPRRLYITDDGRYFYIQNKKRKFVKTPAGINQQQIVKINLGNMVKPKKKRRRKPKSATQKKIEGILPGTSSGITPPFRPLPLITETSKEKEQLLLTNELLKSIKVITDLQLKDRKPTNLGIPEAKPIKIEPVKIEPVKTEPVKEEEPVFTSMKDEPTFPKPVPKPGVAGSEEKPIKVGMVLRARQVPERIKEYVKLMGGPEAADYYDYRDYYKIAYPGEIFPSEATFDDYINGIKIYGMGGKGDEEPLEEEKEEVFVIKHVPYSPMLLSLGGNVIGLEMNNPNAKGDLSKPPIKPETTLVKPEVKVGGSDNQLENLEKELEEVNEKLDEIQEIIRRIGYTKLTTEQLSEYGESLERLLNQRTYLQEQIQNLLRQMLERKSKESEEDERYEGSGYDSNDGLYNTELEVIADNLNIQVPIIASDEIQKIILPMIDSNTKQFGFIINTDDSNGPGKHWTSIFIDNDEDRPSIEFFDPLGDGINPKLIDDIKMIVDKLQNEKYFLFKENMVQVQSNESSSCGIFAMKFLEDRYNDVPFIDATHYRSCMKQDGLGEKNIKKTIQRYSSYL